MVDFLKACPFVTMEDYKWKLSVPMIRLMMMDTTHVRYLTDAQVARRKGEGINLDALAEQHSLVNDFGGAINTDIRKARENATEGK